MWILILSLVGYGTGGEKVAITTHEMTSYERCAKAGEMFAKQHGWKETSRVDAKWSCVKK